MKNLGLIIGGGAVCILLGGYLSYLFITPLVATQKTTNTQACLQAIADSQGAAYGGPEQKAADAKCRPLLPPPTPNPVPKAGK